MVNKYQIMRTRDFDKSLAKLVQKGSNYARAANQVHSMLGKANFGDPFDGLKFTNHGESRIKRCSKYDLSKFCRLIVVRSSECLFLCFTGTHNDCDRWLENNRGFVVKIDQSNKPLITFESADIWEKESRLEGRSSSFKLRLLDNLPKSATAILLAGLVPNISSELGEVSSLTTDEEILELLSVVGSENQKASIFDTLMLLREGKLEEAERGISAYDGTLAEMDQTPESSKKLHDSEDWQRLHDSDQYRKLIEHFSRTASFQDWMLFMHPDQERFVKEDYTGSSKLIGVSGSGKTCVVVKRAIHLAESGTKKKILVLTLNRSLAAMIENLVKTAAMPKVSKRIHVLPLFTLCQQFLHRFEPKNGKLYDDKTWKSLEHIDEVWREYYRCELNNNDAAVMQPVHDSLISRGIDAESYIREEFDWIRSAVPPHERGKYLKLQRTGRSYPLDTHFRKPLLKGLKSWEKKMRDIGVTDYLGLSSALYSHIDKLTPMYDSILVDECQDFGTIEMAIVRRLVSSQDNDLFLCGDAAQQVSSKHQNLKSADINIKSTNSNKLTRNYRNSREILSAAFDVLLQNLTDEILNNREFEVLDPDQGYFNGPSPLLLKGQSLEHEFGASLKLLKEEVAQDGNSKACLVVSGFSFHELERFGKNLGIPVLDGTKGIEDDQIFLSDLENTKGFEFQFVCIINCSRQVLPNPGCPKDEHFRDLARLYVAMTRARHQLVISYNGERSSFIKNSDHFLEESWEEYQGCPVEEIEMFGVPQRLDDFRLDDDSMPFREMSGVQFLYTELAVGLDALLVEKLRNQISGRGKVVGGNKVGWRTIGDAAKDTKNSPASRNAFGPQGIVLFQDLIKELGIQK